MEDKIRQIEKDIQAIKERNVRVEADKAWETSSFWTYSIIGITYITAALVLYFIGAKNFLLSALVPTAGFFLSVQFFACGQEVVDKKFFEKEQFLNQEII